MGRKPMFSCPSLCGLYVLSVIYCCIIGSHKTTHLSFLLYQWAQQKEWFVNLGKKIEAGAKTLLRNYGWFLHIEAQRQAESHSTWLYHNHWPRRLDLPMQGSCWQEQTTFSRHSCSPFYTIYWLWVWDTLVKKWWKHLESWLMAILYLGNSLLLKYQRLPKIQRK